MSYEEAIEVINEISKRFGATATDMYPKLVKYGLVSNAIGVAFSVLILAISVFIIIRAIKKLSDPNCDEEVPIMALILSAISSLICSVVGLSSTYSLVMWLIAPEISAVKFVLGSM